MYLKMRRRELPAPAPKPAAAECAICTKSRSAPCSRLLCWWTYCVLERAVFGLLFFLSRRLLQTNRVRRAVRRRRLVDPVVRGHERPIYRLLRCIISANGRLHVIWRRGRVCGDFFDVVRGEQSLLAVHPSGPPICVGLRNNLYDFPLRE